MGRVLGLIYTQQPSGYLFLPRQCVLGISITTSCHLVLECKLVFWALLCIGCSGRRELPWSVLEKNYLLVLSLLLPSPKCSGGVWYETDFSSFKSYLSLDRMF